MRDKKRHLYIWGEPGTGKTTFWKTHMATANIAPPNNDWKEFKDEETFVVFDEFAEDSFKSIGIH
jgi:hypothetical protein